MSDKKISQLTNATTPLAGTEVLPIVQNGNTVKVSVGNLMDGLNTVTVPKGGTGLTSLSAGFIPYGNNASALLSSANLQFDGANLTIGGVSTDKILASPQAVDSGFKFLSLNTAANAYKPLLLEGSRVELYYAGVKGAELLSNGNFSLSTGNLVIGTAGKGIDFSADPSAAGVTSELLDDYEEGTWTPTVSAPSGAFTTVTTSGTYTKIGNLVRASFSVVINNIGTATAMNFIGALPFTSSSGAPSSGALREGVTTGVAWTLTVGSSTTSINTFNYLNSQTVANGATFNGSIVYYV